MRRGPLVNTAFIDDVHLERTFRRGLRHTRHAPTSSTVASPAPGSLSPTRHHIERIRSGRLRSPVQGR